jgi:hypothetical protein
MVGRFRRRRPSPALVLSAAALFFAIGGSAFAVGQRVGAPQPRCADGAVKGFAYVKGDPSKGIENLGETFTSDPRVFGARFNCSGKAVQVRRNRDVFEVRFPGAPARTAIVAATVPNIPTMTVTPLPDGSFRVSPQGVGGNTFGLAPEHQFVIVVF